MSRITAPVGEVDDADDKRHERDELLARVVEQSFGGELLLALFELLEQRADAGRLQRLDHDLIIGAARIGREPAGDHDLEALLRADLHPVEGHLPDHGVDARVLVLEREINVAR